MRGFTEQEILPFAAFARTHPYEVRFIEFMPLDADHAWDMDRSSPARRSAPRSMRCIPSRPSHASRTPTARVYRFAGGVGRIGFINPVSEPFCGDCDRIRLTADGKLRTCLFSVGETDLREPLRSGATDDDLEQIIRDAVWRKEAQAPGQRAGLRAAGADDVRDRRLPWSSPSALFATLRERAGADRIKLTLPDGARVRDALEALGPVPGDLPVVLAVNREYADRDRLLHDGGEVAAVPPVSGGAASVHIKVTTGGLSLDNAELVRDPCAGAVVVFSGVTRAVAELLYEAYREMAEAELRRARRGGGRPAYAVRCCRRAPHRARTAVRAVGPRRRIGASPPRSLRRCPPAHRRHQRARPDTEVRGGRLEARGGTTRAGTLTGRHLCRPVGIPDHTVRLTELRHEAVRPTQRVVRSPS